MCPVNRPTLPLFVHEVVDDPRRRGILFAGCVALFAVGLVPRVLSPGLPSAQEMLKAKPEIENLFLLFTFLSTAAVILGGLVSDLFRRRALMLGALSAMVAADVLCLILDDGPLFYAANFTAVAAAGIVLAYGIGSVAIAFEGVPRATALGVVYAAYGAGSALAPALLTLFPRLVPSTDPTVRPDFTFDTSLAYAVAGLSAGLALWAALRWMERLPGSLPASRRLIVSVAVWSISILAIVSGVLGLGGPGGLLLPTALIVGGAIGLSTLTLRFNRTVEMIEQLRLDRRGLGAALAVGVAVGFAQAIPLMLLPIVFEYPLGYGQLLSVVAIAPFAVALLLAGPVSGMLIQRFGPRGVMASGSLFLGIANLVLALFLAWAGGGLGYLAFIVPLALIGAGFVFATTVRTAIVFASTPRGLPSSAAAINEASVGLGSRIGIVVATTVLTAAALDSARSLVAGRPDAEALVAEFQEALVSLGTPRFKEVLAGLQDAPALKIQAYDVAYLDGVVPALVLGGLAAIGGAILAWFLTGRRDPLRTVFDMQDEREGRAAAPEAT